MTTYNQIKSTFWSGVFNWVSMTFDEERFNYPLAIRLQLHALEREINLNYDDKYNARVVLTD